jgi:HK97 gp10 family phage protein
MAVTFKSNLDLVLRQLHANTEEAAAKAGEIAVESVQMKMLYGYKDVHGNPPHTEIVDTGRLFDSITAEVRKVSQNVVDVQVGTDVPYAPYVHDGTRKLKGRPFITDGLAAAKDDLENAVGTAWKRGF